MERSRTVLSIGKLAAGQAKYYLDQAEARVDVVQSVGSGVEDYYLGPGEARGRWNGVAAGELGLRGEVEADGLRRVLEGLDPRTGEKRLGDRLDLLGTDVRASGKRFAQALDHIASPERRRAPRQSVRPGEVLHRTRPYRVFDSVRAHRSDHARQLELAEPEISGSVPPAFDQPLGDDARILGLSRGERGSLRRPRAGRPALGERRIDLRAAPAELARHRPRHADSLGDSPTHGRPLDR